MMVSAGFHPTVGGAEKQALELSVALQERGLKVRVATRRLPGLPAEEDLRGVSVRRLWCAGPGLVNSLTFLFSLWRHLRTQAPFYEAIHVHLAGSPALAAALVGRLSGKRVVVKLGGGRGIGELAASSRSVSGRLKLLALRLLRPQFVAVAQDLAAEAREHLGAVSVHVIPNGVDASRYHPRPERKAALRAELGWPADGLGFLYTGRLSPEKRLPTFTEAWAELVKKTGAKAFFACLGDGVEGKLVRDEAERARLSDRVFVHSSIHDVERAYAAADVFVLPSVSEGLSNALLEAMASGLAVLASRVGGTVEAVEEGRTGFLFDPASGEDMRRQIAKFLEHPPLAAQFGRAAREAALNRFALEKVAERYEALYRHGL